MLISIKYLSILLFFQNKRSPTNLLSLVPLVLHPVSAQIYCHLSDKKGKLKMSLCFCSIFQHLLSLADYSAHLNIDSSHTENTITVILSHSRVSVCSSTPPPASILDQQGSMLKPTVPTTVSYCAERQKKKHFPSSGRSYFSRTQLSISMSCISNWLEFCGSKKTQNLKTP